MRKLTLVVAVVVMMVPVFAGVALAAGQIIQCRANPCYGTGTDDLIYERIGNGKNDTIRLSGGNDRVLANAYTRDQDLISGGTGYDRINVSDGDRLDTAGGGAGTRDLCVVDARVEAGSGCGRVVVR